MFFPRNLAQCRITQKLLGNLEGLIMIQVDSVPSPQVWKTIEITAPANIRLVKIYICIHEAGRGRAGISEESMIKCNGAQSYSINISSISERHAFQIYGFSDQEGSKIAVGLVGNSLVLGSAAQLHLEAANAKGEFPSLENKVRKLSPDGFVVLLLPLPLTIPSKS